LKKTYAQNQLLVLFKDYQNQHYHEFIEDVRNIEQFQELQNLSTLSINSDEFTNEYRSLYFFRTNRELRKQFLNTSISIDAELQVITGFFISKCGGSPIR